MIKRIFSGYVGRALGWLCLGPVILCISYVLSLGFIYGVTVGFNVYVPAIMLVLAASKIFELVYLHKNAQNISHLKKYTWLCLSLIMPCLAISLLYISNMETLGFFKALLLFGIVLNAFAWLRRYIAQKAASPEKKSGHLFASIATFLLPFCFPVFNYIYAGAITDDIFSSEGFQYFVFVSFWGVIIGIIATYVAELSWLWQQKIYKTLGVVYQKSILFYLLRFLQYIMLPFIILAVGMHIAEHDYQTHSKQAKVNYNNHMTTSQQK
jgi:predicted permease